MNLQAQLVSRDCLAGALQRMLFIIATVWHIMRPEGGQTSSYRPPSYWRIISKDFTCLPDSWLIWVSRDCLAGAFAAYAVHPHTVWYNVERIEGWELSYPSPHISWVISKEIHLFIYEFPVEWVETVPSWCFAACCSSIPSGIMRPEGDQDWLSSSLEFVEKSVVFNNSPVYMNSGSFEWVETLPGALQRMLFIMACLVYVRPEGWSGPQLSSLFTFVDVIFNNSPVYMNSGSFWVRRGLATWCFCSVCCSS
jgi:hypothetical protein